MSLPSVVFLDTSVFAGQQYNFSSTAFTTFLPIAQKFGLKLLLPDPTEREIKRQISERSKEALLALEQARRRAPFLAKWTHFPKNRTDYFTDWEVDRVATNEWKAFLSQLEVVRLGYQTVSLTEIMNWYDSMIAPFSVKKRKEFPDAFAIAILEAYASQNERHIAVVSEDGDFQAACERFPFLMYFKSLPKLTERFLTDPKEVTGLKNLILADLSKFEDAVRETFGKASYMHDGAEVNVENGTVTGITVVDMNIVAIGERECTITFEAKIMAEYLLQRFLTGEDGEVLEENSTVNDIDTVNGTAKVIFDAQGKHVTQVPFMEFDDPIIYLTAEPRWG